MFYELVVAVCYFNVGATEIDHCAQKTFPQHLPNKEVCEAVMAELTKASPEELTFEKPDGSKYRAVINDYECRQLRGA